MPLDPPPTTKDRQASACIGTNGFTSTVTGVTGKAGALAAHTVIPINQH